MNVKTDSKQNMTTLLESGKIIPLIIRLTVPAVIAQIITFLYNVVDRMFVAKIDGSGMDALAALGIVLPITLIIQAFANLVGLGGSPRAGIRMGEGRYDEANRIFNTSFLMLVIIGVIIGLTSFLFSEKLVVLFGCPETSVGYAVTYLRIYSCGTVFVMISQGLNPFILTQGYSFVAMSSVLVGAVVNIILDPIFIFVLKMGVGGSSLATVISQFISGVCIILFFLSKKSILKIRPRDMAFSFARIKNILSLGFTPFVMTITECAIQIVFNVCLNRSTGGNKDYTAALTVMLSALQLISLPLSGLGNGMQPFVSYNYGRGNSLRLKQGIRCVTVIAAVVGTLAWLVSMAFPEMYAYIFSASDSVTLIVKTYTPYFLMGSVMFFAQMTLQNINVALGQAKSALILAVTRKVILLIPLCFILTHFLGFVGVYMSEGIADLTAGIITAIVILSTLPRIFKKREKELGLNK